jgi:tetratricopeptide (TPR) repeat protein
MPPVWRVRVIVALAAVAAAAVTAGVVLATRQDPAQPKAQCAERPVALVVPGVRSANVEGVRAALQLDRRRAALRLQTLADRHPRDPVVQFNYGTAAYCAGYLNEATAAYTAAKKTGRNTFYEMRADEILHPQYLQPPDGLYPTPELQSSDPLLVQGVVQQRLGHQHTAERLWAKAARLHPDDPEAQVAAAYGLFDEDNLSASFSRLGPLVKRFPQSQTVRFHLGLLLAWIGQRTQALREFRAATELGPGTKLGRDAQTILDKVRTSTTTG